MCISRKTTAGNRTLIIGTVFFLTDFELGTDEQIADLQGKQITIIIDDNI